MNRNRQRSSWKEFRRFQGISGPLQADCGRELSNPQSLVLADREGPIMVNASYVVTAMAFPRRVLRGRYCDVGNSILMDVPHGRG
ncbi:hypothetical protein [Methanopyrus sp. KOL6]|uniref:hypothetical protein n=1 Tax=Methanopyrus sp. KOL6 TaxID=1937004 RepID=UPI0012F8BC1B|nr:hypothetical protein [Methanopyrus sp. KOL6]